MVFWGKDVKKCLCPGPGSVRLAGAGGKSQKKSHHGFVSVSTLPTSLGGVIILFTPREHPDSVWPSAGSTFHGRQGPELW